MKKKTKVLFSCYGLGIGGIEKCLVNLLNIMSNDEFDIDLLLMNPETDFMSQIKRPINYIDSFQYVMNTTDTFSEIKNRGGIFLNFRKFIRYCKFRLYVKLSKDPWKTFKSLPDEYDIAISYSQNDYSPYYIIDKVFAKKKILWYHNGAYEASSKKYKKDKKYYLKFDYVVAVSNDCMHMLSTKFNFKEHQLIKLHNIYDKQYILNESMKFIPASYLGTNLNITTVARLTSEKGADLALKACKKLRRKYSDIRWHWIGDGNQRKSIEKLISDNDLKENFIIEGNKCNPYPYIKHSIVYVQPSYFEAYSTTITETKVLSIPIVTTDVGGMREQLRDNETGLITPTNVDSIVNAISRLLDDDNLRTHIIKTLQKENCNTSNFFDEYKQTIFS
ncbi:MAG: glycosyltransferase [Clostridiales bacterium]|nr:glycosyltransferase [Clostridiales bacterium]